MGLLHDLARKHQITPQELAPFLLRLQKELAQQEENEAHLCQLKQELQRETEQYLTLSRSVSEARKKAAGKLTTRITQNMKKLGMPNGRFEITVTPNDPVNYTPHGIDQVEFLVTTNPGQPLMPLQKVASGGELSRISLAIQVINAQRGGVTTLVFDEVDVGIGGGVAEIVGKQLRGLSKTRQILCVTHLPQVASQAANHLRVAKMTDGQSTRTSVKSLTPAERIEEIARMLGGVKITDRTRAHAEEMLG